MSLHRLPSIHEPVAESERYTDVGNARRLVALHGHELRYVPQWDAWLYWDGQRWRRDIKGRVVQYAKHVAAALWDHVGLVDSSEERKRLIRWANHSETAGGIRNMIGLAHSEPGVAIEPDELDGDPWLLNVANGTLDLRAGTLRPHRPQDLITKLAPVRHTPGAAWPVWAAFLERILPDPEVRLFVQRSAGYALTGLTSEQVLFFAYGGGANGKTTLFEALIATLGDYARHAEPELLLARDSAHPTGIADLQGARLVVASEIDEGRRLAEATVKQLTGGDRIKARYMRQDFFEFAPTHKLFLHANHRPLVRGTDHAIWRRLRLIPFTVTIPKAEQDADLPARILAELEGVLAWAVQGCLDWQKDGLTAPAAVVEATDEYRADMDVLGAFFDECCLEQAWAQVASADLYRSYVEWCEDSGERPVSQRRLGNTLTERGFDRQKIGHANRWHWVGIGLIDHDASTANPCDPKSTFPPHAHAHASSSTNQGRKGRKGRADVPDPPTERLPYPND